MLLCGILPQYNQPCLKATVVRTGHNGKNTGKIVNFVPMDAVITYVNGHDPLWLKDYSEALDVPILEKRFRDWDTLKYLLRGIEVNMPFIENVHLVVARESQVPEWVDRNVLKVVLHEDFVPAQALPTFNCNPLELHLHRIPDLSEKFLYFNDDMFPMKPCSVEDFYVDGKPAINFSTCLIASGSYKSITRNSDRLARKALGLKTSLVFKRPQHTCSPMLRSAAAEVYSKVEKEILSSLTKIRTRDNFNQYLFLDYLFYSGRAVSRRIPSRFFSLATASSGKISSFIQDPSSKIVCINDVRISQGKFESTRARLLDAFEKKFPNKSRFEL